MIRVEITNLQSQVRLQNKLIRHALMQGAGKFRKNADLSLVYVDNRMIRRLNIRHLGYKHTTDVLAFHLAAEPGCLEGEIIVSAELAKSEAKKRNIPIHQEILYYTFHGLLHLLGYNHIAPDEARAMQSEETRLVRRYFGGFRP